MEIDIVDISLVKQAIKLKNDTS